MLKKRLIFLIPAVIYFSIFFYYILSEDSFKLANVVLTDFFSSEKIDAGKIYFIQRIIISFISLALNIIILLLIYKKIIFKSIYNFINLRIKRIFIKSFLYIFLIYFFALGLFLFPLNLISFLHLKSYGIIITPFALFLIDFIKSLFISSIVWGLVIGFFVWLFERYRKSFPFISTLISFIFAIFLMVIYPIFITPIFNKFEPLKNNELKNEIIKFLNENNMHVKNLYVMNASIRTQGANAYVSGLGPTKEIVLYDTLIKDYTKGEIISILAHEIGHYDKHHIWIGLMVFPISNPFSLFVFFYLIALLFDKLKKRNNDTLFHIPIIILIIIAFFWISKPFINSASRKMEREADLTSLYMTKDSESFISSSVKLYSKYSYHDYSPNWFFKFLFYTHPPVNERIGMAMKYKIISQNK